MNQLLIPAGSQLKRLKNKQLLVEQWDDLFMQCVVIVSFIYGAIAGGGDVTKLKALFREWQPELNGKYTTMVQKAAAISPEAVQMTRGVGFERVIAALTNHLDGGAPLDELEYLAQQFDPLVALSIARRQMMPTGGRPQEHEALYNIARPIYRQMGKQWKAIATEVWKLVLEAGDNRQGDYLDVYNEWSNIYYVREGKPTTKARNQVRDLFRN